MLQKVLWFIVLSQLLFIEWIFSTDLLLLVIKTMILQIVLLTIFLFEHRKQILTIWFKNEDRLFGQNSPKNKWLIFEKKDQTDARSLLLQKNSMFINLQYREYAVESVGKIENRHDKAVFYCDNSLTWSFGTSVLSVVAKYCAVTRSTILKKFSPETLFIATKAIVARTTRTRRTFLTVSRFEKSNIEKWLWIISDRFFPRIVRTRFQSVPLFPVPSMVRFLHAFQATVWIQFLQEPNS